MENSTGKVIVITGADDGIGYATVEDILKQKFDYQIVFCVRNKGKGHEMFNNLIGAHPEYTEKIHFFAQEVGSLVSMNELKVFCEAKFTGIDAIIHNAEVYFKDNEFNIENLRGTFQVNVEATMRLQDIQSSILNPNGKVIFISAKVALETYQKLDDKLKSRLFHKKVSKKRLDQLKEELYLAVETESWKDKGWHPWGNGYGLSKLFLLVFARLTSVSPQTQEKGHQIYIMLHRLTKMNLNDSKITSTPEEDVETITWILKKPFKYDNDDQGCQFINCEKINYEF